jgi:hypothetical protein
MMREWLRRQLMQWVWAWRDGRGAEGLMGTVTPLPGRCVGCGAPVWTRCWAPDGPVAAYCAPCLERLARAYEREEHARLWEQSP